MSNFDADAWLDSLYRQQDDWQRNGYPPKPQKYRKGSISAAVRREVAAQYGCTYGNTVHARCEYCLHVGAIHWFTNSKPGWPAFIDLELDHRISEFKGGPSTADNIVLACLPCNRAKRERNADEWMGRT